MVRAHKDPPRAACGDNGSRPKPDWQQAQKMGPHWPHSGCASSPTIQGQDGWVRGHITEEQEIFTQNYPDPVHHTEPRHTSGQS